MFVGIRSRIRGASWILLVGSTCVVACQRRTSGVKPQASASASASALSKVPAPDPEALKQGMEALKKRSLALRSVFQRVRTRADAIPPGLDKYAPLVERLETTEKVFGVADAKVQWLSGRLATAQKENKAEELNGVWDDIKSTSEELKRLEGVGTELAHELVPYERTAALLKTPYSRQLPQGQKIVAVKGGIEQQLIEFIQDSKKKVEAATWIDFDPLLFPDKSGQLDVGRARDELENVSRILKAYPNVKLDVGAYPDDTGPITGRRKFPTERTAAVKAELIRLGVEEARLASGTHDPELPPCIANVEGSTCYDKTGRVAVRVTAK